MLRKRSAKYYSTEGIVCFSMNITGVLNLNMRRRRRPSISVRAGNTDEDMILKRLKIAFPVICMLMVAFGFISSFAELRYPRGFSFVEVPDPLSGEQMMR